VHKRSIKHLSKDKYLGKFVRSYGPLRFRREHALGAFQSLAESIIYQQIVNMNDAVAFMVNRVEGNNPRSPNLFNGFDR